MPGTGCKLRGIKHQPSEKAQERLMQEAHALPQESVWFKAGIAMYSTPF